MPRRGLLSPRPAVDNSVTLSMACGLCIKEVGQISPLSIPCGYDYSYVYAVQREHVIHFSAFSSRGRPPHRRSPSRFRCGAAPREGGRLSGPTAWRHAGSECPRAVSAGLRAPGPGISPVTRARGGVAEPGAAAARMRLAPCGCAAQHSCGNYERPACRSALPKSGAPAAAPKRAACELSVCR
jgi:hypothetical protein